jgi:hypothetical protein
LRLFSRRASSAQTRQRNKQTIDNVENIHRVCFLASEDARTSVLPPPWHLRRGAQLKVPHHPEHSRALGSGAGAAPGTSHTCCGMLDKWGSTAQHNHSQFGS